MRLVLLSVGLWAGFALPLFYLSDKTDHPCAAFCWHALDLGTTRPAVLAYLQRRNLGQAISPTENLQWQEADTVVRVGFRQQRLQRLDINWDDPATRPILADLMLVMGAPDGVYIESRAVANVRAMIAYLVYFDDTQVTLFTLRRLNNNPQAFGNFKLQSDDRIVSVSRYSRQTRIVLQFVPWRGFAEYPTRHICC